MSDEATVNISPENLQMQIEGFSNFDRELVPGLSMKKMMSEVLKASSSDLFKVKPSDITVLPGYNPRVHNRAYFEGVEELANSMVKHGYYQDKPLACFIAKVDGEDRLVLQDGHRRHAAVTMAIEKGAQIKVVPVVLKDRSENAVDLTLALLHSNEGQPFTLYEKAVLAKRLKKSGWENKQIAEEFKCTPAYVGQLLAIAGAPQVIAELVQNGNMSGTEAYRLMLEQGAEEAAKIAGEGMERAKAAGRTKVTAKDLTPAEHKAKNAKKHAYELYRLVKGMRDDPAIEKKMTDKQIETADAIIAEVEKKPKVKAEKPEPKAKAEKKPKAEKPAVKAAKPAAKKTVPVAKKIEVVKGEQQPGETVKAYWERITKASKGASPQARRSALPQRASDL